MHHNKKVFEDFSYGQWRNTEEYLFRQCQLKPTFTKVATQNGAFKEDLETAFLLSGGVAFVRVSLAVTSHLYLYSVGSSPYKLLRQEQQAKSKVGVSLVVHPQKVVYRIA